MNYYLGIDLGATNLHFALVDAKGKIVTEKIDSTSKNSAETIRKIVAEIKHPWNYSIKGVGIAVAGLVDHKKGKIYFAPNLGWKNLWLVRKIKKEFPHLKIILENDANAAAWGAYLLLGKERVKNLICLTLGTGLGGGIVIEGKLYRGASGSAGEIGHLTLYPDGLLCKCGNFGCIERYVGANYLVKQIQNEIVRGKKTIVKEIVKNGLKKITPELIARAAGKNDRLSREIWKEMGKNLGTILAGVINLLNPEMLVLTGGVAQAGRFFLGELKKTLRKRTFQEPLKKVKIVVTNKNLGVIGAALLARNSN